MICLIKLQQVTYVVPGIEDFDHIDISEFVQKAQGLLVSFRKLELGDSDNCGISCGTYFAESTFHA